MKYFLSILFLLTSVCSFAQNSKTVPQEERVDKDGDLHHEKQKKRQEWLYNVKHDPSVSNPEAARWEAFTKSQCKFLETQSAPVANWQCWGPTNQAGRMLCCAIDPTNSSVIYAGASTGGLWKSTNSGNTWTPITDNLPSLTVGAVAINPQNPNMILIGTGEGYLLSSWFQYGVGVLKSMDGGLTWNPTNLIVPDSIYFASLGFAWDPINTNNVYITTTYGVLGSQDAGTTWAMLMTGVGTAIEINKQSPNIIYAAFQDYNPGTGGIYRSTDYGQTWNAMTNGLPPPTQNGFTSLTICDSFPNVLYAGVSYPSGDPNLGRLQGLYKTSNGGNSWTLLPFVVDFYCYPSPYDYICQGWYGNVTKVSPIDTNNIWASGIYMYVSTDGGINWNYADYSSTESPPYVHPDHHGLVYDPANPLIMYSLNDGGIYRTSDGGGDWITKNDGLVTTQFYYASSSATDPDLMIGGTQDNGIWFNYGLNSSTAYTQFTYGDGFSSLVDHTNSAILYSTEIFRGRMKSIDSGVTYDTINTGITENTSFIEALVMHPTNNQILFTASDARIYKTTNAGANWVPVHTAPYVTILEIDPVNPNIIYGCTDPALGVSWIYRSMNGGSTWTQVGNPGPKVTDIECDPASSGTLYACRSQYAVGKQVYRSTNFGATWTSVSQNFPQIPVNTLAINPNNHYHIYAGSDLGVYLSIDGGVNWNSYNDNLPNAIVQDMHYYPADSTIRCGTLGRGIWKTKAADPTLQSVNDASNSSMIISAYPNPAVNNVMISYNLLLSTEVSVKIFNQLGQEVNELVKGKQDKGLQKLEWNCKNAIGQKVADGVYYARIIYGKGSASVKLIVASSK